MRVIGLACGLALGLFFAQMFNLPWWGVLIVMWFFGYAALMTAIELAAADAPWDER